MHGLFLNLNKGTFARKITISEKFRTTNNILWFPETFCLIKNRQLLKTLWEKGKIARNEQFLLFPECFLLNQIIVPPFVHLFDIISLLAVELEEPKIGI